MAHPVQEGSCPGQAAGAAASTAYCLPPVPSTWTPLVALSSHGWAAGFCEAVFHACKWRSVNSQGPDSTCQNKSQAQPRFKGK